MIVKIKVDGINRKTSPIDLSDSQQSKYEQ